MACTEIAQTATEEIFRRLDISGTQYGACGKKWLPCKGGQLVSINPHDRSELGQLQTATVTDYEQIVLDATEVFGRWRMYPAPKRGQIVRAIAEELRTHKDDLGMLVTLETG